MTTPTDPIELELCNSVARYIQSLHARAAEILDIRYDAAQNAINRDGYYCPDELPLGAELSAITAKLEAMTDAAMA